MTRTWTLRERDAVSGFWREIMSAPKKHGLLYGRSLVFAWVNGQPRTRVTVPARTGPQECTRMNQEFNNPIQFDLLLVYASAF